MKLVHLVGVTIGTYYDVRAYENQMEIFPNSSSEKWWLALQLRFVVLTETFF